MANPFNSLNQGASRASNVSGDAANNLQNASSSMPSAPSAPQMPNVDPSSLPDQLPSVGEHAAKADALVNRMNTMDPSQITPDMTSELNDHLSAIQDYGNKVSNPLGEQLEQCQQAQQALSDKYNAVGGDISQCQNELQDFQQKTQDLQSRTCQLYCNDSAGDSANFSNQAQAQVTNSSDLAKQKAAAAAQQHANDMQQKADAMSGGMLSQVDTSSVDGFQSSAQQAMFQQAQQHAPAELQNASEQQLAQNFSQGVSDKLNAKYPGSGDLVTNTQNAIQNSQQVGSYIQTAQQAASAQNAASQLQAMAPQSPQPPVMPQNPLQNLNSTVQGWQLPVGSSASDQLAQTQSSVANMFANPIQNQLAQVQGMKDQFSQLPSGLQQQVGSNNPFQGPEDCMQENITANASEPPEPNLFVVAGAQWQCSFGGLGSLQTAPGGSEVNGQAKIQPLTAIAQPSGMCSNPAYPPTAAATAAAFGTLTPTVCGCLPNPAMWEPNTMGKVTGNGQPFLTNSSKGMCALGQGGMLSITFPGQTEAKVGG